MPSARRRSLPQVNLAIHLLRPTFLLLAVLALSAACWCAILVFTSEPDEPARPVGHGETPSRGGSHNGLLTLK